MKLRILFLDIETAPLIVTAWNPKQRYIRHTQLLEDTFMLAWSAKWDDQKQVMSDRLTTGEALDKNDDRIVLSLAELIRKADVIVAHNLKKFDLKRVNARVALHKQEPIGPTYPIDTLDMAKRGFGLPYYTLDYLAGYFGLGEKLGMGMDLWLQCMLGDEQAFKHMVKYNKQDVVLLEKLFFRMLPYVEGVPRLYEADEEEIWQCNYCPTRGKENFQLRGVRRTQSYSYHSYQCKNCGKYGKTRPRIRGHKNQLVPI